MYARILSYISSAARLAALLTLLCLGVVQEGYGQRVYADEEQHSSPQRLLGIPLSQVIEPEKAIYSDADKDTTDFSRLLATVGALSLIEAHQNLQFVNSSPDKSSPLIIKFSTPGSLLELLGGFYIQRTLDNELVAPQYGGSSLLNLLNLFGGGQTATFVFNPNGEEFDGIRLTVRTALLDVNREARLYYAFYITPPEVSPSPLILCGNSEGSITITNFQPGYNYRLYNEQIGGTAIDSTTSNILNISSSLNADTLWLEAKENNLYPSARTPIAIKRNFVTGGIIAGDQSICASSLPSSITVTDAATGTGTLTYQWQQKTTGSYEDIVGATTATYTPPALFETTVFRRVATSELDSVKCMAYSNDVTITVNPLPTITLASIPSICEGETTATLPYANTTGDPDQYSIIWDSGAVSFTNVTDETLTADAISIAIPPTAEMGTYAGTLMVRNSETGCESEAVPFTIDVLPQPDRPHLIITDVQN